MTRPGGVSPRSHSIQASSSFVGSGAGLSIRAIYGKAIMWPMPGAEIELPPTDEDRTRVINLLRGASSRLGLEETERRMDAAVAAATKADLALLVWDLPDAAAAGPAVKRARIGAWRSPVFRAHATTYVMVNGMLVGIWELTSPHALFWPFFPIAGWGIGLVGNAFGVRAHQRQRYRKEVRRLEKAASRSLPQAGKASRAHRTDRTDRRALDARATSVIAMFTDMVDSTRLNMVIGDEDWARVRRRYRQLAKDAYDQHNGREVNTAGDGFLARFDRAADAARCAMEIQRQLQKQREDVGFAPPVRIGINSGPAIEEQGDVLGTTVNLASRVTAAADPNEILVTEAVADLLDDRFHLKDSGLRDIKGLDRKTHVFTVTWS